MAYTLRDKYPRRRGERMRWWCIVIAATGEIIASLPIKCEAQDIVNRLNQASRNAHA